MNDIPAAAQAAAAPVRVASVTRTTLYACLVLIGALAAAYYRLRTDSVFGCQAGGYSATSFLSYCQVDGYGDFDHGAFWFKLEPQAAQAAADAQVLFIGNSRLVYGFSTSATHEWFEKNPASYYLLGFAYNARVLFMRALLQKQLAVHPRVYIINMDEFFGPNASAPAKMVMQDPDARSHYRGKQIWQSLHRNICGLVEAFCGHSYAIFRDTDTGMWHPSGLILDRQAASEETKVDADEVAREAESGKQFLASLGVDPQCVILTLVPTVDAPRPSSTAIAAALHEDFISPSGEDLLTFDGSHLEHNSAERWSSQFFEAAGPKIRQCLGH
jgi:hypothetical protein